MINCCNNKRFFVDMPELTINVNCDTLFAINLKAFGLSDNEELIFSIKNFNYADSDAVFSERIDKKDENENGEVLIKIPPQASKEIKPMAFYNFTLVSSIGTADQTYTKITDNGKIRLEYGAQDLTLT